MKKPRQKQDEIKRPLTGSDVARMLGVSYVTAIKLPIPRLEVKTGVRIFRRYQEKDVVDYIEKNTKQA